MKMLPVFTSHQHVMIGVLNAGVLFAVLPFKTALTVWGVQAGCGFILGVVLGLTGNIRYLITK
jgi:hypothetical protein